MRFTLDSDLNGASPQFTLTCISTGGPATTVTWTRNSVTVNNGNKTVLDSRTTSQYTHTLTVTGRLGGLYTCTVANNRPTNNETSAQLTVQGTCNWWWQWLCRPSVSPAASLIWVAHCPDFGGTVPTLWLPSRFNSCPTFVLTWHFKLTCSGLIGCLPFVHVHHASAHVSILHASLCEIMFEILNSCRNAIMKSMPRMQKWVWW